MSSRVQILSRLGANKPAPAALPEIPRAAGPAGALLEAFTEVAVNIGSQVFAVQQRDEIWQKLAVLYPQAKEIVAVLEEEHPYPVLGTQDPHALAGLDLAILQGAFGVAENSSIWLSEAAMGLRVLPFICQHLALIIRKEDLVANMHEAYQRLAGRDDGYGVFIAGPSKTADIEQSLVLGAHGPRSLSLFVLEEA